jgi:hypothetical protein
LNDVRYHFSELPSKWEHLSIQLTLTGLRLRSKSTRNLIVLATIIVPVILLALQYHKVNGLNNFFRLYLVNPPKDKLDGPILWVYKVSLKYRLAGDVVLPAYGPFRHL